MPIMAPPIIREKKFTVIPITPDERPFMIFTEIIIKIMQVASFSNDSPSIKLANFLGAPTSFKRATTAAVSVHDIILPNRKAPM